LGTQLLQSIHDYLLVMADEITNLGISMQSGLAFKQITNFDEELKKSMTNFSNIDPKNSLRKLWKIL
jgi:hypothetical protein